MKLKIPKGLSCLKVPWLGLLPAFPVNLEGCVLDAEERKIIILDDGKIISIFVFAFCLIYAMVYIFQ